MGNIIKKIEREKISNLDKLVSEIEEIVKDYPGSSSIRICVDRLGDMVSDMKEKE